MPLLTRYTGYTRTHKGEIGEGEGERVHRFAVVCMVMLYTPPLLCGLREAMGLIIGLGAGWFPRAWDRGSRVPFKRFNGVVG